jgi:hypothetical protein
LLSHVTKTDSGVAFGVLLLSWSILCKLDNPEETWANVLVGFALALTMSFKQTAVLVAAPLLVGMVVLSRRECRLPWSEITRGFFITLITCVLAWIPMNIGIFFDVKRFLEWQRFTLIAVESGRSASVYQIVELAVRSRCRNIEGLTAAGVVVWLIAPWIRRDLKFLMLWGSSAFAYVAINVASGPVIHSRYYFPYDELAFTLGCVAALSLIERPGLWRAAGLCLTAAILVCAGAGSLEIIGQAMTPPIGVRCSKLIRAITHPDRDKILTADLYSLGVPIDPEAAQEDRRRDERLASKYGLSMPKNPRETLTGQDGHPCGYYARMIPYSLGGDPARKSSLTARTGKVTGFWWPIQHEEWDLEYWTTRGFTIFVLAEGAGFSGSGMPMYDEPLYRTFHEQIKERCELVATLPTARTWFYERTLSIYRLRDPKDAVVTHSAAVD